MIHTSLVLHCTHCHTDVGFVDEKPNWKIDEERLAKLTVARDYVASHTTDQALPESIAQTLPEYVSADMERIWVWNVDERYVECPNCGGKVMLDDSPYVCWLHERACEMESEE